MWLERYSMRVNEVLASSSGLSIEEKMKILMELNKGGMDE